MRGFRHWRWHLDEVFMKINGETHYLWRAVDHGGEVLESYVTRTRDKKAALVFMRKALKRHGSPEAITTDGLRSYGAAWMISATGRSRRSAATPTTACKTASCPFETDSGLRFRSMNTLQKFALVYVSVSNHLAYESRHFNRQTYKARRSAAFAAWQTFAS